MGFRFESLEIYQQALSVSRLIFSLVRDLQNEKHYVYADQLARACLSISNNIAEGSGSNSNKDFANFLNISRRSLFECASMIIILNDIGIINIHKKSDILLELDTLSRRIQTFRKVLLTP
jgi:four helix bundle protein